MNRSHIVAALVGVVAGAGISIAAITAVLHYRGQSPEPARVDHLASGSQMWCDRVFPPNGGEVRGYSLVLRKLGDDGTAGDESSPEQIVFSGSVDTGLGQMRYANLLARSEPCEPGPEGERLTIRLVFDYTIHGQRGQSGISGQPPSVDLQLLYSGNATRTYEDDRTGEDNETRLCRFSGISPEGASAQYDLVWRWQ